MVANLIYSRQLSEILPLSVGVFEDDPLLIRLADRFRFVESGCPPTSGQMNSDDLALKVSRLDECAAWAF